MKKIITVLALSLSVMVGIVGCSKKPDLQKIYDTYCDSVWSSVGSDGSYLTIDTNPLNVKSTAAVFSDAQTAIWAVNDELGLPESLNNDMGKTTALMGLQTETFDDAGVTVSWTYHPSNGLEVTYKLID